MNDHALKPRLAALTTRVGVLLPLPLKGAYDYRLEKACPRGTLVNAPIGPRESLGVVWCDGESTLDNTKLKLALPLEGEPRLPEPLCDFVDWLANYTLTPPGAVLALALRARQAFEPELTRIAYVRGAAMPQRMTSARERVLGVVADGLARSIATIAEEAGVSPAVVRGLIEAGALAETSLPEFTGFPVPDYALPQATLNDEQAKAAMA